MGGSFTQEDLSMSHRLIGGLRCGVAALAVGFLGGATPLAFFANDPVARLAGDLGVCTACILFALLLCTAPPPSP